MEKASAFDHHGIFVEVQIGAWGPLVINDPMPLKRHKKQLLHLEVINIVRQFTQIGLFYVKTLHTTGLKW